MPSHGMNMRTSIQRFLPAALALSFAGAFVAVAAIRLEAQGLYYDELHQAPAAFAWLGRDPPYFSQLRVWGVPLLNMSYSGALKSALFGWWLRLSGSPFDVASWRMAGILLGAFGVAVITAAGRRRLPALAHLVMGALVLGDVSLLVMCRHDWGPVALGFALRALFIASWVAAETSPEPGKPQALAMGALVGLAIFEKLSSVVLVVPLAILVAMSPRLRARPQALSALAGLAMGSLPLVVANVLSWRRTRALVSLGGMEHREHSFESLVTHLKEYASLGPGEKALDFVLGVPASPWLPSWNTVALCFTMLVIVAAGLRTRDRLGRMAAASALSWVGVGVALWLLPRGTWIHHWIVGTPFQYVAMALAVVAWGPGAAVPGAGRGEKILSTGRRILLVGGVGVVALTGFVGAWDLGKALARGRHGAAFSPDLSELGLAAGKLGREATFIAADWGVATQIYCLSNGRDGVVDELFWDYRGAEALARAAGSGHGRALYLVGLAPPSGVAPDATRRIFEDASRLPGWQEAPVEEALARLRSLVVRKYLATSRRE